MKRYVPSTPRFALGLAAAVMSALTFGVFAFVPANLESRILNVPNVMADQKAVPTASPAPTNPAPVDAIASYEPKRA